MAAPGNFTTLAASGAVTFPSGAAVGYLWQCSSVGGLGGWVPLTSLAGASGSLTVSNDTNITATFTGSNTTALLNSVTINLAWASTLATSRGGTNFNGSGLTLGDILYASSGTSFTRLAGNSSGTTRKFLVSASSGGVATAPIWDYLTSADLSGVSMNFSSIGFSMSPPTNAYISTTNRAGIAGANYQFSLGGTYTGISTTTSIIDLDITTTHTSTTSTLATSAALQITSNTNATSATITNAYGILLNGGTNAGGTVTTAIGLSNVVPTFGATNYGYQQTGTFTKASDIGVYIANTFTPTATANVYQLSFISGFNSASAVLTNARCINSAPTFTISTNNATTIADYISTPTFTVSGVGTVTTAAGCYINPTINITTASTGTRVTNMYGLFVQVASGPVITTASTVLGSYYNVYSGTIPTLTGAGKFTTVYGGYFAAPLTTTTDASTGSVALWADSLQVGGAVSGAPVAGTIRVGAVTGGIICASAALATNTTVGFLYAPSCAGTPSGGPTNPTGTVAQVYDSTNNIQYVYNSSWKAMPFSSSGSSNVNATGPNGFQLAFTYYWKVIGGVLCSIYLPDGLTTWTGGTATSAITFTGSGNPVPTIGASQRFPMVTFQGNTGSAGYITITNNTNNFTIYLTTANGFFTGNAGTTGWTTTTFVYTIQ